MTTILTLRTKDGLIMAADSQITDGTGRKTQTTKISQNGLFLISGAGDCLPLDIAQHLWRTPTPKGVEWDDLLHFMIKKVIPSLRAALIVGGYKKDEDDKDAGFTIIFAIAGQGFVADDDYSISTADILGAGSGGAYGIGAISAGATIEEAMAVAALHDTYTSAPFIFVHQPKH